MSYCCPMCGTWSCEVLGAQAWKAPDGTRTELVAMRCGACRSFILARPTQAAIDTTRDRKAQAAGAMRAVAGA